MWAKDQVGEFFRGSLSGLTIIQNETENDTVLQCLNRCQEDLEISGLDDIVSETSVSLNTQMNLITVSGLDVDSVEQLLHKIAYVNSRVTPTPGQRPLLIQTELKCSDGRQLDIGPMNLTLNVHESDPIEVVINGSTGMMFKEQQLRVGQLIFPNLTITAHVKSFENWGTEEEQRSIDRSDYLLLNSCAVKVEPKMDSETEHLAVSDSRLDSLGLNITQDEKGLIIVGVDRLQTYETLLRQVAYVHRHGETINFRLFLVSCSVELSQHFFSNQLQVKVEVVHVLPVRPGSSDGLAVASNKVLHPVMSDNLRMIMKSFPNSLKYDSQETGIGVAVVMVICIGFVIMLIVLGVMRVRSGQNMISDNESIDQKPSPEWDSSGLTITVNPMDPEIMYVEKVTKSVDETDSDGEEVVYQKTSEDNTKGGHPQVVVHKSTLVL